MDKSISRRTFIGTTATAAIAGSASMKSAGQTDRRTKVGIVGLGSRGRDLLTSFRSIEQATIVALCDDYRPHLDAARHTLSNPKRYHNYRDMLTNEKLDAIVIAAPPNQQHAMCTAAIDRGLAVYCETPMGLTIDEASDLAERAEQKNAIVQVGLQRRANAVYEQAEAMIQTRMLGEVTAVKCQWHENGDERRELPVSKEHSNYTELNRKLNWRLFRDLSQGLMTEYGIHQLDVVNRLLGVAPRRVIAMGGNDYWHDDRDAYDNVYCTYEYAVGQGAGRPRMVRASFSSILTNAHEGTSELIMGTKGTLLLSPKMGLYYRESGDAQSARFDARSGATDVSPGSPWAHRGKSVQIEAKGNDTQAALRSFVDSVASGNRNTICDARTGLEGLATALIANKAIESGMPVLFPENCRNV